MKSSLVHRLVRFAPEDVYRVHRTCVARGCYLVLSLETGNPTGLVSEIKGERCDPKSWSVMWMSVVGGGRLWSMGHASDGYIRLTILPHCKPSPVQSFSRRNGKSLRDG